MDCVAGWVELLVAGWICCQLAGFCGVGRWLDCSSLGGCFGRWVDVLVAGWTFWSLGGCFGRWVDVLVAGWIVLVAEWFLIGRLVDLMVAS